jgi:membrane protein
MTDRSVRPGVYYAVREFVGRLRDKVHEDEVFLMAGAVSFNLLIAIVPLLILGIGVAGYVLSARFGNPTEVVLSLVASNLPAAGGGVDMAGVIRGLVSSLLANRSGLTLLGAPIFVWLATRLVGTLRIVLREIFDISQSRGLIRGKVFDVQVVLIGLLLVTLNMGVTVAVEAAMRYGVQISGLQGGAFGLAQRLLAHVLALASIWVLFLIVYRYLPARRIPWKTALVAATFTAFFHEALKEGLSWYATSAADWDSMFGNLATVAVLFFWIYYEALVFILGGEIGQVYTMRKASRLKVRETFEVAS